MKDSCGGCSRSQIKYPEESGLACWDGEPCDAVVDDSQQFDLIGFHKNFVDSMHEICKKKNADYTGGGDPFHNFKLVELLSQGGITAEQGLYTRMTDKMSRLHSFIKNGTLQVKDESVSDTLADLANYCILFAGYLKNKD